LSGGEGAVYDVGRGGEGSDLARVHAVESVCIIIPIDNRSSVPYFPMTIARSTTV
jgi:hypothetical protein